jgi:2-polyprenyl-3-methyl-5-hydroxy-6-metoxy-1,4-benzoquinol methylase
MTTPDLVPSIRTAPRPHCALCGQPGLPLYETLEDRLFGVVGTWRLAVCGDRRCGLVWMHPMPLAEDLGNAYQRYYTHDGAGAGARISLPTRAYRALKCGYLDFRYGYRARHGLVSRLGWLMYLFPVRRGEIDNEVRYLPAQPGGRLLDLGCGSGAWLLQMRDLGWQVRGLDFDPEAVALARRRGLEVDQGPLEDQRYRAESFDVITLNHVIEHVPDPVATLAECRRVLRPGGRLMLFTPNTASLGHRLFKDDWRGLEPPRHLHLFGPNAMHHALLRAGFSGCDVRTTNSRYLWRCSLALWAGCVAGGHLPPALKVAAWLLTLLEQALMLVLPAAGECLAVRAVKS